MPSYVKNVLFTANTEICLLRWKLGRSCIRKTPVSSVAILKNGYGGSEVSYLFSVYIIYM